MNQRIFIIGAGNIGSQIIETFAMNGYDTYVYDSNPAGMEKGLCSIESDLLRRVNNQKITQAFLEETMARIRTVKSIEDAHFVDAVVEVVYEDVVVKQDLFEKLDQIFDPSVLLMSNTSSICITAIAARTKHPERVCGLHFYLPVPTSPMVEVARGYLTSDASFDATCVIAKSLHKQIITVNDAPGFVFNRVIIPMINEAAFVLMEGVASAEDIDRTFVLSLAHKLGPLALADLIGLDTVAKVLNVLHTEFEDDKYRLCPLIRQKIRANQLGRKTGQGFFRYE